MCAHMAALASYMYVEGPSPHVLIDRVVAKLYVNLMFYIQIETNLRRHKVNQPNAKMGSFYRQFPPPEIRF